MKFKILSLLAVAKLGSVLASAPAPVVVAPAVVAPVATPPIPVPTPPLPASIPGASLGAAPPAVPVPVAPPVVGVPAVPLPVSVAPTPPVSTAPATTSLQLLPIILEPLKEIINITNLIATCATKVTNVNEQITQAHFTRVQSKCLSLRDVEQHLLNPTDANDIKKSEYLKEKLLEIRRTGNYMAGLYHQRYTCRKVDDNSVAECASQRKVVKIH